MPKKNFKNHFTKKTIFAAACILAIVALSTSIVDSSLNSSSIVYAESIKGIGTGIYWDQGCTNKTLSLKWGQLEAGSSNNLTVYVRNEGNSAVSLLLSTSNWVPSTTSRYMTLNWSYANQVLKTNEVIPIELTLTISPKIEGTSDFSYVTTVTAIGV
jgi:hypothetical protein